MIKSRASVFAGKSFLARDIYERWRDQARSALKSITLYSPYLDDVAIQILESSNVSAGMRIVVTAPLDAEHLLEFPAQLRALKKLFTLDYRVLAAKGLHAKVLLMDDESVSFGSQNFTRRGRRNKECSVNWNQSIENTKFLKQLISWREQAEEIDELLIDALLAKLKAIKLLRKKALADIQAVIDAGEKSAISLRGALESERQKSLEAELQRIKELEAKSRLALRGGAVFAEAKIIDGPNDTYWSLCRYRGGYFTEWSESRSGEWKPLTLGWLNFYPAYIVESKRLAFVRLGRTRITYFRPVVTRQKTILGKELGIRIHLSADIAMPNLEITLSDANGISCTLSMEFSGDQAVVLKKEFNFKNGNEGMLEKFSHFLHQSVLADQVTVNKLVEDCLSSFRFKTLEIEEKTMRKYLDGTLYRISLIEFQALPVLIVHRQH